MFAVALFQVLFMAQGAQGLFRDSDTGWHIRNGESILESRTAPGVDPFSYTRAGRPWFAWEWLSDIVLAAAHKLGGLSGVALIAALAIALSAWGAARLTLSLGGDFLFTAASMILLLSVTSIHWLARPHVFSWGIALLFLAITEHDRRSSTNTIFVLPVLACLWANLHGSFLLGPAILLLYAAGELPAWRRAARFAIAALVSLAATFINPYGWHLHEHVVAYLQNDYLMNHISEFRSFSFHASGAYYVEAFLVVAVIGVLALLKQRAFGPALLCMALLHISLYSARHLATSAVLVLPLTVAAITLEVSTWPQWQGLLAYSGRLRDIDRKIYGLVPIAIVLAIVVLISGNNTSSGFHPLKFPVAAARFLEQSKLESRIFAKDQWGGYLIYRFGGRMKVFIDGRSDFYGSDFLETYAVVAEGRPGWQSVLKQYDVRAVLVAPNTALSSVLQLSPDWKRVYGDAVAEVFELMPEGPESGRVAS